MNELNFKGGQYPLSIQAMAFMQEMINSCGLLTLIGGKNYILSGCETTGKTVSDGWIVVNGELLPFQGGTIANTIAVIEEAEDVNANGMTFERARIRRYAKFGTGTGENYLPWGVFNPLPTNQKLDMEKATTQYVEDEIKKLGGTTIPAGVVVMWSGSPDKIPEGWALCDGTQKTPDLRGRFVVGYNRDDADYNGIGKSGGGKTATLTTANLPAHTHKAMKRGDDHNLDHSGTYGVLETNYVTEANGVDIGLETVGEGKSFDIRPPYYVLAYIIKL